MNRIFGRIFLPAALVLGVAVGAATGALAAEKVRYHGFYDGGELFTVRALFRQVHGKIRVPTGLGDIDMDGVPEVFVTDQRGGYCGTAGCSTSIYKNAEGKWIGVGALQSKFGESGDPIIYIREEVVGGMRTYYSSHRRRVEDPGPDQLMKFGTVDEMITDEEWPGLVDGMMRSWLAETWDRDGWLYGRHALNDDGIDEVLITSAPGIG